MSDEDLRRFGYSQELLRDMGGFSSFAMSFSIISVLTGCITTYGDALGPGGPAGVGIGWPLVSVGTLLVAVSMAELASAFPTAGALYHWSALLGGARWGWLTAMLNLIGQVAIVGAVDLGCARELCGMFGLQKPGLVTAVFLGVLASHVAYDASAHPSEETKNPERKAPWGIVLSVVVSAVAGYALLVGLTVSNVRLVRTWA
jgi:amino acid transporter